MHSGGDNVASGTAFPSPSRLVPVSVCWVTPPLRHYAASDWLGHWGSYDGHRLPPRSNGGQKRGLEFAERASESEASGVSRSFKLAATAAGRRSPQRHLLSQSIMSASRWPLSPETTRRQETSIPKTIAFAKMVVNGEEKKCSNVTKLS